MHDPKTVAFELKNPFSKGPYKKRILTIWHCDPEKDGTDDSCGWFIRSRHIDPKIMEKVEREFAFNFKHNYWFNEGGYPKMSIIALTLNMYSSALWQIVMIENKGQPDRKKHTEFMSKHLYEMMHFAENATDSLSDGINMKYGYEEPAQRIKHFASIVVADIFRKRRKWYQHPKWHIQHWKLQFHPLKNLKRRYWDKCSICGKRGFKTTAHGDWEGTKIWHAECDRSSAPTTPAE